MPQVSYCLFPIPDFPTLTHPFCLFPVLAFFLDPFSEPKPLLVFATPSGLCSRPPLGAVYSGICCSSLIRVGIQNVGPSLFGDGDWSFPGRNASCFFDFSVLASF